MVERQTLTLCTTLRTSTDVSSSPPTSVLNGVLRSPCDLPSQVTKLPARGIFFVLRTQANCLDLDIEFSREDVEIRLSLTEV